METHVNCFTPSHFFWEGCASGGPPVKRHLSARPRLRHSDRALRRHSRVVGLEPGADDYPTKPFNLRKLSARARAVLRRGDVGRAALRAIPSVARSSGRPLA
jgi:hypothetical protein